MSENSRILIAGGARTPVASCGGQALAALFRRIA